MPRGFKKGGKILKLRKALYGLQKIICAFWKYIAQKINNCGLEQPNFDPCIFIGEMLYILSMYMTSYFGQGINLLFASFIWRYVKK